MAAPFEKIAAVWMNWSVKTFERATSFTSLNKAKTEINISGSKDDLIPAQALFLSANLLSAAEVPVEWHLSPGIGHGIDGEGLRHGGAFLAKAFKRRT